nr:hypothetical protein [Tanacetum cinerariifolium]
DLLFQPLFDEVLTSLPSVDHPAPEVIASIAEVVAPKPVASTGSPSSTTVNKDAPSPRYSSQLRAYKVFNKRRKVIVETIHVNFDELPQMASDHVSSDTVPQCQRTALEHDSLSPGPQCQENVPYAAGTVTMSNELDLLFSPMFNELLNGSSQVVSKSSDVTTADAPNQC